MLSRTVSIKTFLTTSLVFLATACTLYFSEEGASVQSAGLEQPAMKFGDPLPENAFVELAKHSNPAVVSIATAQTVRQGSSPYLNDPYFQFFEQFFGRPLMPPPGSGAPRGGAPKEMPRSMGSGFIIEEDGLIVTNNHVVDGADAIRVQLLNDREKLIDAELVGRDPLSDIALIKIKVKTKLPVLKLGESSKVEVGQWVAAFGNPYGHTFSVSKGIVSAIGRRIQDLNAVPFIQTDASINPGNSGGPLVNTKGEVIAVNAAIDARAQGIGFAIPIDHVKSILPQLKSAGKVTYGYLGVYLDSVTPELNAADDTITVDEGAILLDIAKEGPADKAGLKSLDVVTRFDGRRVTSAADLANMVKTTPIGKKVDVEVVRGGKALKKTLTVEAAPETPQQMQGRSQGQGQRLPPGTDAPYELGFRVKKLTDQLARQYGLPAGAPQGLVIVGVAQNSPAARSGLRPGDILLSINKKNVLSESDLRGAIRQSRNVLKIWSNGRMSLVII
ncbi:MAG: serine protease MucD [Bdellovibrionales bacterium CG10_big_fil_rev_8_21_14_0_10_45_34]|nr:MAG: serine protease MucD [Bdellovibrionales bacterium CG10_big_fil_rev_8_21_14_0_10_45_34]